MECEGLTLIVLNLLLLHHLSCSEVHIPINSTLISLEKVKQQLSSFVLGRMQYRISVELLINIAYIDFRNSSILQFKNLI